MKRRPHEEQWEQRHGVYVTDGGGCSRAKAEAPEDAALIAAAPAMARLLLELMTDPDLDDYAHGRAEAVLRAAGALP